MWYITYDRWNGGLAHNFCDLFTTIAISNVFNIEYLHTNMYIDGREHRNTWWYTALKRKRENWVKLVFDKELPKFFNFKGNYRTLDILNSNHKIVNISNNKPFTFITLEELRKIFSNYNRNDNILFRLITNNRIWIWEFYDLCNKNIVEISLFNQIRNKFIDNMKFKPEIKKNTLSIHIRKGDCDEKELWSYNILTKIQKLYKIEKIIIHSMGTEEQMKEISNFYNSKNINILEYKFNKDTIETVKEMLNSEIIICSSLGFFSKTVGFFSRSIKFYTNHPYSINNKSKGELFPSYLYQNIEKYEIERNELYDFSINMIYCDHNGNFDENIFLESLRYNNKINY